MMDDQDRRLLGRRLEPTNGIGSPSLDLVAVALAMPSSGGAGEAERFMRSSAAARRDS